MGGIGFFAIVSPRSSIHTKISAQRKALQIMRDSGQVRRLVMTGCVLDEHGHDLVQVGRERPVRLRRMGLFHSVWNMAIGYPEIYRRSLRAFDADLIDVVYVRKPTVFDMRTIKFMRSLRQSGIQVVLEIPTFPYDRELRRGSLLQVLDRQARRHIPDVVDLVATVSDHAEIFGVPTINILNCVPVDDLPISRSVSTHDGLRMTCVSALEPWHRVDRILQTLIASWESGDTRIGELNIVGQGNAKAQLMQLVASSKAAHSRVTFHGALFGEALSEVFDATDIAIGNLEVYDDRGLRSVQALKHGEYAARGLPFVYGLTDHRFADVPYALKLADGVIDISEIVEWYGSLDCGREYIRADAMRFRWETQFLAVIRAVLPDVDE